MSKTSDRPAETAVPPRVSSGAPYLDEILGGGWLRGGLYVIGGPPGSGKTTLANQFCYSVARRGEHALFATLLVETHGRMLLHLSTMTFFDREAVGERVFYVSGNPALEEGGLDGLLVLLTKEIRERSARALVVDGMSVVREKASSLGEYRKFLHALAAAAAIHDCTTVLLVTEERQKPIHDEYALADGIVALSAELVGLKATRGIEVLKLRGSNHLPGRHTFLINDQGVLAYPRFEAVHTQISDRIPDRNVRLRFGIENLDRMCMGGLVSLSSTLVLGSPGSGKTLLGLHFLTCGADEGEPGLYFGFAENAATLVGKAESVGLALRPHTESGRVRLEARAPVETLPDALAQELVLLVERHGIKRLFIDGLEPFAKEALDPERTTRFVSALLNALRDRGVTVLLTQQTNTLFGPDLHAPIKGVEAICDNLVFLRFFELGSRLSRMISVLKMRDSDNDPFLRELVITSTGVDVHGRFTELEALMTGQPRNRPNGPPAVAPKARPVRGSLAPRKAAAAKKPAAKKPAAKKPAAKKPAAKKPAARAGRVRR
jgi:circadian clock protein KaiC